MDFDLVPIPSQGLFYEGNPEYLTVLYLTTKDELTLTSPNLFNKGDALNYILDKNVCKPNNLNIKDLLLIDKEFLVLFLKETAYGNIIENTEKGNELYFDTHNMFIRNIVNLPESDGYYHFPYKEVYNIKIKLLKVSDERVFKKLSLVNKIIYQIHSINNIEDKNYISQFIKSQSILDGRLIKKYIDTINFGVNKKTFCIDKGRKRDVIIDLDETFFGLKISNLPKINRNVNTVINFLVGEGRFSYEDIKNMPVHLRRIQEELLIKKIQKMNESAKK